MCSRPRFIRLGVVNVVEVTFVSDPLLKMSLNSELNYWGYDPLICRAEPNGRTGSRETKNQTLQSPLTQLLGYTPLILNRVCDNEPPRPLEPPAAFLKTRSWCPARERTANTPDLIALSPQSANGFIRRYLIAIIPDIRIIAWIDRLTSYSIRKSQKSGSICHLASLTFRVSGPD